MRIGILAMVALTLACFGGSAALVRGEEPAALSGLVPQGELRPRSPELLDELDEARINMDLLKMEVEADRKQIERMMTVLGETKLQEIQGLSRGPIIGGNYPDEREARIKQFEEGLGETRSHFVTKSKQLARERRRVAALEDQLGLCPKLPTTTPATVREPERQQLSWNDAQQLLTLVLKGVGAVQRWTGNGNGNGNGTGTGNGPGRPAAPEERRAPEQGGQKDAEQFLNSIRRGIERWQKDTPPAPEPAREAEPAREPEPAPELAPEGRPAPEPSTRRASNSIRGPE
jgi:hypothetical protein